MYNSIFPSQWKTSIIIPHYKAGPFYDCANYRPINHTPVVSRLMERIVKEQITSFLLNHNLILSKQHGFIKSRSCTTCQLDFLNHTTGMADDGKALIIIYLDMTKAFDRVSHTRLLSKVKTFGIIDPLFSWLTSYLANRSQVVSIDGHLSSKLPVTSGVIQGSVLGPLLFLLYIKDELLDPTFS
ncbi:reverse transcriptase domain-containing protein [Streptococcus dysgalactiae]|uniref:reverse transcriptase domain-containing protein n=1 Tax=Streptococcus dysgalactiae TaxID=1334 RepID=UPI00194E6690|nr:reverse transcriptase domain-containing protein [Streptococcus dysgalactiae]MBM6549293.1 hypothetical protein [Streptococcus dysgalactiae subsp. equisimilis]